MSNIIRTISLRYSSNLFIFFYFYSIVLSHLPVLLLFPAACSLLSCADNLCVHVCMCVCLRLSGRVHLNFPSITSYYSADKSGGLTVLSPVLATPGPNALLCTHQHSLIILQPENQWKIEKVYTSNLHLEINQNLLQCERINQDSVTYSDHLLVCI